jgi:NAD kinase
MHLLSDATRGQVVADGLILGTISSAEPITIRKGPHLVKLVKRIGSTYYDLLRQKLLWAADATSK